MLAGIGPHLLAAQQESAPTTQPMRAEELRRLSLEELMSIEVTSVAKQRQKISEAPAAIYVITPEDIRRSGFTSIPEALRLAPGLEVARVSASRWGISARGFNDVYANKLLVLVDGRTIYTPLFSGVYWDAQDYVLQDLDRIEVIRGPGATLWGANAVNGVINIVTKSARDTQGLLVDGIIGNIDQIGAVRYGGQLDDQTFYRFYGKYRDTDPFRTADDRSASDDSELLRGGFRIDRYPNDRDELTLIGDWYGGRSGEPLVVPVLTPPFRERRDDTADIDGGNILARWTRALSDRSDFTLQLYYDRLIRDDIQIQYQLDTYDIELQHRFPLGERHDVIWGVGHRSLFDRIRGSRIITFNPRRREDYVTNAFIQDDITLVPDKLHLIVGSKFEVNSYTGFELQPGVRALWTPNDRNTFWAAVSRAVRTPSRWEEDARIIFGTGVSPAPPGLPFELELRGDRDFDAEELVAYELGHRVQATSTLAIDTAIFYNAYDNLRNAQVGPPTLAPDAPPRLIFPASLNNDLAGQSYGLEVAATWTVRDDWRLSGSYTFLTVDIFDNRSTNDVGNEMFLEGADPQHQFQLRSYWDLTRRLELNANLMYVDELGIGDVPAYVRLDVGLTWKPNPNTELSVYLQNVLDDRHPEFGDRLNIAATEIPRSLYFQLVWRR